MKHHYNLNVFNREDSLSYYLLGVFCSDGNVKINKGNKGIASIASKDKDWLQQIISLICETTIVRPDKRNDCFIIEFYSLELVQWLIAHGCMPKKSLTLKFPDIPINFLADFIRGCWDGDGTLGTYRRYRKDKKCWETHIQCKIYTGSKTFAETMQQNLLTLDIKSNIRSRIPPIRKINNRTVTSRTENYYVDIQDKQSIYNFCKTIYYDNNPLTMSRKLQLSILLKEECSSILKKPTTDQINQILTLVKQGLTYRQIGDKFDFSKYKIYRIVTSNQLSLLNST